jgi:hypothetical protein
MKTLLVGGAVVSIVVGAVALVPVQSTARSVPATRPHAPAKVNASPPARSLDLLFIHHSVGDQLLADPGRDGVKGQSSHGGGLRRLLEQDGYRVRSATYGSKLGEHTDLFDWPEKFGKHVDELVTTEDGSVAMTGGKKHDVVMFKSCFPNNRFVGRGEVPGSARGPALTVENAKAALRSILPTLERHPQTLFVYLTIPPNAPRTYPERLGVWALRAITGKSTTSKMEKQAELARELNSWVVAEHGWLEGYPRKNVAVIDYFDLLAGSGQSNFLVFPSKDGKDSHPTSEGQKKVAPEILRALNAAVERAGIGRSAEVPAPGAVGARVATTNGTR